MPGADAPRQPAPVACDEERLLPDARWPSPGAPKGNKDA
jgi:hypothetical protein